MGQHIRVGRPCPMCGKSMREVWHRDNHGGESLLEVHCSRLSTGCGYAEDAEGNVRHWGVLREGNQLSKE